MKLLVLIVIVLSLSTAVQACIEPYVLRVVDGDTLMLKDEQRVRVVGEDTPERGECGFADASNEMDSLVDGKVGLVRDVKTANRDVYGRLLRYVTDNNRDVGYLLVKRGYAEAYTRFPFSRSAKYVAAQEYAKLHGLGLWGKCGHP